MAYEKCVRYTQGDKNAVLFIHGFLGSPDHFRQFIPKIPQSYAIYNLLLHGHGGEVLDFANSSMEIWKSQVRATVRALAKQFENIVIVAHSMGCFFAMESAAAFPVQVKAIFLLGVPFKIFVRPAAIINAVKLFLNIFPESKREFAAVKNVLGVKLNRRVWEYAGWIPRYAELFTQAKRARETVKRVTVPCFIFQSENDEVVSLKSLKYVPDKKNFTVAVLHESSHFIYSESDFQKIGKALWDFLS